jgi:cysteine desulfurase family protein (TIGR01976 family)
MDEYQPDSIREKFPALSLTDNGQARVYLDNPAGTQVPASVASAIYDAILVKNANLGGYFATSIASTEIWENAHLAMADFLGAAGPEEIVIGPNMTTLTYHLSRTIGRNWGPDDEVICTHMDHEGNVGPWMQIAQDRGASVKFVPFSTESWQVEEDALRAALTKRTKLVALSYASNLTGSINRIKALTKIAREAGALVYIDAVQFAPHGFIDVMDIGCDFLACSAYKFFGPHLGIVWGRRQVLDSLLPYKLRCSTGQLPGRLEIGTPQIELLAGLTACINYFSEAGITASSSASRRERIAAAFSAMLAHEAPLARQLIQGVNDIDGLVIKGITDPERMSERVPTVSFTMKDIRPESLVRLMNQENIFLWAGHNYAWEAVRQLGISPDEGVVRIGIAHYNNIAEIDQTIESIRRNIAMLRQYSRKPTG